MNLNGPIAQVFISIVDPECTEFVSTYIHGNLRSRSISPVKRISVHTCTYQILTTGTSNISLHS